MFYASTGATVCVVIVDLCKLNPVDGPGGEYA